MRHLIAALAILLASVSYSGTAISGEKSPGLTTDYGQYKDYMFKGQKDECLIVAKNCIVGEESVMQRAERLQREIDKGSAVYTPEELKSFQEQLNWIYSESVEFSGGV
jgi:hypothetical protein